jgi:hypothetical protein
MQAMVEEGAQSIKTNAVTTFFSKIPLLNKLTKTKYSERTREEGRAKKKLAVKCDLCAGLSTQRAQPDG